MAVNSPPQITSNPITEAFTGKEYIYHVLASDPENDSLSFELLQAPVGMTIDSQSGVIRWTPDSGISTSQQVEIKVSDSHGETAKQIYSISIINLAPPVSYMGKNFLFMVNHNYSQHLPGTTEYHIMVSAIEGTSGTLKIPALNLEQNFSVSPGDIFRHTIDTDLLELLWPKHTNEIEGGKTIEIVTTNNAAVYAVSQQQYTTDAQLILPETALGNNYRIHSYGGATTSPFLKMGSLYSIVGVEDGTSIEINPTYDAASGTRYVPAGEPYTITLNRGEIYNQTLSSKHYLYGDTSGTGIKSNKPVAVYSGHLCAFVPSGFYACDHLIEQSLPVESWGTTVLTAPLAQREKGDTFRIYSSQDNSDIYVNDDYVATLDAGQFREITLEEASIIQSNKPISVTQFSNGYEFDKDERESAELYGDPFMLQVPTQEQYLSEYIFSTPQYGIQHNFINVIAKSSGLTNIKLDGTIVDPALFHPIQNSSYHYAQIPVGIGSHRIVSDSPVGLSAYGFDVYDSYGYLGGASLNSKQLVDNILLEPPQDTDVNSQACITAIAESNDSTRISNTQLSATISGANIAEVWALTDITGRAQLCYTGHSQGLDTIVVRSGTQVTAQTTLLWTLDTSINHSPYFTSKPDTVINLGETLSYSVNAKDIEDEQLDYTLLSAPQDTEFNSDTNSLIWHAATAGEHRFELQVTDEAGNKARQHFLLQVKEAFTEAPVYTSTPLTKLSYKNQYIYKGKVESRGRVNRYSGQDLRQFVANAPDNYYYNGYQHAFYWSPPLIVGQHDISVGVSNYIGDIGYQNYTLEVTDTEPPIFTALPPKVAYPGEVFTFQVQASDPDNDALTYGFTPFLPTYSHLSPPAGMTIDPLNGQMTYAPQSSDIGVHHYVLVAHDGNGGFVEKSMVMFVTHRPEIASNPLTRATVDNEYQYQVVASDPDGQNLNYRLSEFPPGMVVHQSTGLVTWTPTADQIGTHAVTIVVRDSSGGSVEQSYTLTVETTLNQAPLFTSAPTNSTSVGSRWSYQAEAEDADGDLLLYSLNLWPDGMNIDTESGLIQWQPTVDQTGEHEVEVAVTDGRVYATQQFLVTVEEDKLKPVVLFVSPAQMSTLTTPVDIVGSITDAALQSWRLLLQRTGSTQYQVLGRGDSEVHSAVLGTLDPTLLINGLYKLVIEAIDTSGNTSTPSMVVQIDSDLKVGNFSITFEDLAIPMAGIPIEVTRTYDSRQRFEPLDFGYGWSIDYQNVTIEESRAPGRDWYLNTYQTGPLGHLTNYCVEPYSPPRVVITLPDGRTESFEVSAEPHCNYTPILDVSLVFNPMPGTTSILEAIDSKQGRLNQGTEHIEVLGGEAFLDPSRYKLTTKAGYIYELNQDFGIEKVIDPNGHTLTYSDTGIVHSSGKSIDFIRDGDGRITAITDPSGQSILYNYDANGDLTSVSDQLSAVTRFSYNQNHGLLDITDPLGRKLVKNLYDADGRLIAQEDNEGNRTDFNHDIAGRQSIVTDRLGRTTAYYYDERGNITSMVDALGQVSSYTFDAFDNQLSETNPLGYTQSATYDNRRNQLTQTDALNNTINFSYNNRGQELTITDAKGNVFTNTYDNVGNLLTITDPLGHLSGQNINAQGLVSLARDAEGSTTHYQYDSEGNVTQETTADGAVITYAYDTNNNRLSESRSRTVNGNPVTETTSYHYDARNRLIKTIDPLGKDSEIEYNLAGQESARIDAKGRRTEYEYDPYGRLLKTTYPDGSIEQKSYDKEGNLLDETDRSGRTTTYEYDALNRLTKTTYPDSSTTETVYDALGRVIEEIDERGHSTSHSYDAADRRISTTDALGNTTSFDYDANGNLIQQTDAKGQVTEYVYDKLDQRTKTVFDDATSTETVYDKIGRQIETLDQNGRSTQYAYDGLGRLTEVADALGNQTTYTYDEAGNKLTQTDAEGRTTRWTYDAVGRELSRTLPLGQSESFAYDAVGNRTSHTDFNGNTHSFDYGADNDRLIGEHWADGNITTFNYNNQGIRISASDQHGQYSYTYDERDRLLSETKPDGSLLEYTYDSAGNKLSLSTTVNGELTETTYGYDDLNRLSTVTDAGGSTTYNYDEVGNRAAIVYSNGTTTEYAYDSLNRLITITHKNSTDTVLASFDYTLDATGRRTRIIEHNGRTTDYSYDELYRLTGETITDAINGNYSASYQYDKVGNRTDEIVDGMHTQYTYDDNDRLLQQGGTTYTYDDNGNTLSEAIDNDQTQYQWDSRNRLVQHNKTTPIGNTTITLQYDIDKNRIEKTVTESGSANSTQYIVDNNQDYAPVIHEVDRDTLANRVTYTYGDDLLAQNRANLHQIYHYDGLGSTRLLTDSSGNTTDIYQYEAFGQILNQTGVSENSYLFTGEQFDSTLGQYYLRARYYDPNNGRFTQMDEWRGCGYIPLESNKFIYSESDPANKIDPSGYFAVSLSDLSVSNSINKTLSTISSTAVGISVWTIASSIQYGDYVTRENNLVWSMDHSLSAKEVKEKSAERKAYKKRCTESKPPGLSGCDLLRWLLRRNQDCKEMRENFARKWYNDNEPNHVGEIKNLEIAIETLLQDIEKFCK